MPGTSIAFPPVIDPEPGALGELRERAAAAVAGFTDSDLAGWEQRAEFPEPVYAALRDAGLLGLTMPPKYGGGGLGVRESCVVLEELAFRCGVAAAICQMFLNGPP
ncbi:MAG: acyl-CoA dehydrogenase family protein, partial [Solirubrobacterales bacterium]